MIVQIAPTVSQVTQDVKMQSVPAPRCPTNDSLYSSAVQARNKKSNRRQATSVKKYIANIKQSSNDLPPSSTLSTDIVIYSRLRNQPPPTA